MKCERCGNDSDKLVLLPTKKSDGSLNEIACYDCALISFAYCEKHQMPHLGFIDDETTACRLCIEEMIIANKTKAEEMHSIFMTELPPEKIKDLGDWAQDVSFITGDLMAVCILRAVVTKALRLGVDIDDIVKEIIKEQSVNLILPKFF